MARGVGLDAGVFEVKVVELDGSYRKPRLTKVSIDRVQGLDLSEAEEGRARLEAEAALHALKDQNVSRHGVNLGFPSREAVIRNLKIPFVGDDAIRKVIKFEAEGAIHSHNVDDMVVDFATYERGEGESSVIVAAVPKKSLAPLLSALEEQGIDPERVDLDAMALYRAAEWAGCFGEQAAEAAAAAAESGIIEDGAALPAIAKVSLGASGRKARIVVDVGARSARVLALVEDRLIDMRALRLGADSIAEALLREFGISLDEARDAVTVGLASGRDVVLEAEAEAEAEPAPTEQAVAEGEEVALAPARAEVVPYERIVAARDSYFARLETELMRFLTALPRIAEIERLYVTGAGSLVPGTIERLGALFACTPQPLDVLGKLSHDLDADEAEQIGPRIAVAVGLALAMLGGKGGFDFRQEEFAYRKRFDRVKFPLAIVCMLGVFLPFIYGARLSKQLDEMEKQYGKLFEVSEAGGGRGRASGATATFWGYVGDLMNAGRPNNVIRNIGPKDFETLTKDLVATETFDRLKIIRARLQRYLQDQQERTGVYENLQLPSGVYVLSYFADVLKRTEPQLGSFLIVDLDLKIPTQASARYLQFKIAIRGPDFRQRAAVLQDALRATFNDPTSPFKEFGRAGGEDVFEDPTLEGAYFTLKLDLKEDFDTRAAR